MALIVRLYKTLINSDCGETNSGHFDVILRRGGGVVETGDDRRDQLGKLL